ncbi:MAG: histone deacetylase family protein [Pseudomonadota bacterium]|nr:histone deacetylase family protein [Pseudomonadota bacterium]
MKVVYSKEFDISYCSDPAAAFGRIEAVYSVIKDRVKIVNAVPAAEDDIAAVHTQNHLDMVRREGIYDIAALAAGGAVQAAQIGLKEPCFALIRPPGHHASAGSSWGFCYFNNMAIALEKLKRDGLIGEAMVLDFDLHFGDGTVNILGPKGYVKIYNPSSSSRRDYLQGVRSFLEGDRADIIGISAGFDNHVDDWGGLLQTGDYREMGEMVREAAARNKGGCFAILEGGYNHRVLGQNVLALIQGMEGAGA